MRSVNQRLSCHWRYIALSAAAVLFAGSNLVSATSVGIFMNVQSVSATAGDNNVTLEVTLTNSSPNAITIGGFSFGLSVSNSDLAFTAATNATTTAAYIFPGADSLFGPTISVQPPNLPGQAVNGEDIFATAASGATVASGTTVGLGHITFNVAGNAPTEDIPVTLSSTISSLSDANGNAVPFTRTNGNVHVTAACPQVLTATVNDNTTGTGNNQFDYTSGGWAYYTNNNFTTAFQKDEHYAVAAGNFALFRFTGTQVKIYTVKEPAGGNIRYTLDGDTAGAQIIDNFSATQVGNTLSYTSPVVSSGSHTLKIEVLGTHNMGSSNTITVDKAEVYETSCAPPPDQALSATINDNTVGMSNNQFDYSSGGWSYYSNNNFTTAFQKDEHYAYTAGVFALFRFNGTQVKIYTVKEPAGGNIRYTLDGDTAGAQIIDNYSATQVGNALSYMSPVVPAGDHVLKIEVLGTHNMGSSNTITIDKAEVYVPVAGPVLTATVNDNTVGTLNNQFDYTSGGWSYYSNASFNTAFQKDEHYAFTTGVAAHFRFNGKQVKIYTVKEPAGGFIRYTLDGTNIQDVDNFSATQVGNSLSYTSPVVSPGDHDLKIEVKGMHASGSSNTITVDKAEVFN